jgi:hypothetical protein
MEFLFPHNLHLRQPLGNWIIQSDSEWIDNWVWFLSADREFLYFRLGFKDLAPIFKTCKSIQFEIGDLCRATVCSRDGGIHLLSSVHRAAINPPADNNIQHLVGNRVIRKPQLPWTMSTLRTSPSIEGLLLALRDGAGCAVSDGSYYPNEKVGATAWIIITPDGTEWIEGGGVLPGPADVQNSYRSELGGQVSIASCLHSIK